jgi:hypothetical protein
MIDDAQYDLLLDQARLELRGFTDRHGAVSFRAPAHIATSMKPA